MEVEDVLDKEAGRFSSRWQFREMEKVYGLRKLVHKGKSNCVAKAVIQ